MEELPPFDPSFPLIEVDQLAQQALQPAAEASRADGVGIDIHDLLFFGFRLRCWRLIAKLSQQLERRQLKIFLVGAGLLLLFLLLGCCAPLVSPEDDLLPLGQVEQELVQSLGDPAVLLVVILEILQQWALAGGLARLQWLARFAPFGVLHHRISSVLHLLGAGVAIEALHLFD